MRGALWALGALAVIGGGGMAILTIMGAAMSDSPSASEAAMGDARMFGVVALAGFATIGAGFWFR